MTLVWNRWSVTFKSFEKTLVFVGIKWIRFNFFKEKNVLEKEVMRSFQVLAYHVKTSVHDSYHNLIQIVSE